MQRGQNRLADGGGDSRQKRVGCSGSLQAEGTQRGAAQRYKHPQWQGGLCLQSYLHLGRVPTDGAESRQPAGARNDWQKGPRLGEGVGRPGGGRVRSGARGKSARWRRAAEGQPPGGGSQEAVTGTHMRGRRGHGGSRRRRGAATRSLAGTRPWRWLSVEGARGGLGKVAAMWWKPESPAMAANGGDLRWRK